MSIYSFKVTKGRYQLSVTTTDRDFVVEQFAEWVKQASQYVSSQKSRAGYERVNSQIDAEKEITQKKIDEQLKRMQKSEPAGNAKTINQEKEKALDVFYAPKKKAETNNDNSKNDGVFDNILDKSINNPQQTELSLKQSPTIKKDNAFLNYIGERKIEKKIDYLLLTAYYFTQYEQKPRFTLKQLNAKLMQNIAIILDHSVVQEAINRDYIECLPDLTGVVGASEYRLTAYGEKTLMETDFS